MVLFFMRKFAWSSVSLLLGCFITGAHATESPGDASAEQFANGGTGVSNQGWVRHANTGKTTSVIYTVVDEMAVVEGDIVLGTAAQLNSQFDGLDPDLFAQAIAVTSIGSVWRENIMPYQIDSGLVGGPIPQRIATAIDHIESRTSMTFIERTATNASQYPDFIEFIPSTGCASFIGKQGGRQNIWLADSCSTGNIIHEIGHALGLYHEQSRSDRNSYITVHWENITSGAEINFQQQLSNAADIGNYDYDSIMHYGRFFFSSNGSPTITPINPSNAIIGQRISLSSGDSQALEQLYATDLSLALQVTPSLVNPGEMITLSAHITNLQGVSAREVTLIMPIPEDSVYLNGDGDQWYCLPISGYVICERNLLSGSANTSLDIFLSAPPNGLPLVLTAHVNNIALDTNSSNNADSAEVIINSANFAPIITTGQVFDVYHLSSNGTVIGIVQANDFNNDPLSGFNIDSGALQQAININPQTGELSIANNQLLDIDETPEFTLGVTVSDGMATSSSTNITIRLQDTQPAATSPSNNTNSSNSNSSGGGGGGGIISIGSLSVLLLLIGLFRALRGDTE